MFEAIYQTIEENKDIQIIGIYVAPLREHLSVPTSVVSKYPNIPVYKILSEKMKTTDEYLKLYKQLISSILKNKNIWKINRKVCPDEKVRKIDETLRQSKT